MNDNPLLPLVEDVLARDGLTIPIFNKIALELQKLMREREYSLSDITKVILKDPGLASDVLKMANSSFYAGLAPAKTVQDATVRLGAKTIYNLVTAVTQKELYRSKRKELDRWMKPLWSHSLGVAFSSRWVAIQAGMRPSAEECFMAGLLHDIGKLVILRGVEELYASGKLKEDSPPDLIGHALETVHTVQGEQFMTRMNMPDLYSRVAGRHHDPDAGADGGVLSVVRLVNLACRKAGVGLKQDPEIDLFSSLEAKTLSLEENVLEDLQERLREYVGVLQQL